MKNNVRYVLWKRFHHDEGKANSSDWVRVRSYSLLSYCRKKRNELFYKMLVDSPDEIDFKITTEEQLGFDF